MSEKAYILNIYNTMTGEFELVQVTKEVFQTYRRTKWHIEDSTERFYKHETQVSSLIGGENDGYERFHEFIDYDNTPENQAIEEMVRQSLLFCQYIYLRIITQYSGSAPAEGL